MEMVKSAVIVHLDADVDNQYLAITTLQTLTTPVRWEA
jgi:hypothetical protein